MSVEHFAKIRETMHDWPTDRILIADTPDSNGFRLIRIMVLGKYKNEKGFHHSYDPSMVAAMCDPDQKWWELGRQARTYFKEMASEPA